MNSPGLIPVQHTTFYMQNLTRMQNTQSLTRMQYLTQTQVQHEKSISCAEHTKSNLRVVLNSDSSATQEIELTCDAQALTDHSNKIKQHQYDWHTRV